MKHYFFILLSVVLAGCGGKVSAPQPPGHYTESAYDEDFALNCDEIWKQSEDAKKQISWSREWLKGGNDPQRRRDQIRDYGSRLRVLHRLSKQKGCYEQWGEVPSEPGQLAPAPQQAPVQNAPAPREKSRVIICDDDKTCIVE